MYARASIDGKMCHLAVCHDIEGDPTARVRWVTDTFAKLGETAEVIVELERAVF